MHLFPRLVHQGLPPSPPKTCDGGSVEQDGCQRVRSNFFIPEDFVVGRWDYSLNFVGFEERSSRGVNELENPSRRNVRRLSLAFSRAQC